MDALVRWARPISAGRIAPLSIGQRYVAVTFDDAFESVLQNALPELEKRTIPATIFVIAGLLGQTPGWEGYPGRTMTLEELRKLPADLVTIGSHTMTHRSLLTLCEQEAMAELFESRVKLEELLRRKIRLFSFPFGAFQEEMVEWCRKAGYDRVFTTMPNAALTNPAEFVSGRVLVEPTDWPLEFYLKLLGSYRWLPWAYSAKQRFFPSRFNHEGVRDRTILNRDSDSIGNKTAVVQ
jgi:peptidoglycan/xylan/chitin deacetylase (PgdA/CDA1 family)